MVAERTVDYDVDPTFSVCVRHDVEDVFPCTRGVQAQTIATFYLALEQGLTIIPVANKVDMDNADVPRVSEQMSRAG